MNEIPQQHGFSIIELMLAIAIGSFVILAAAFSFQSAKKAYAVNENVARLQEQAQLVLDILEEDIQIANFWGLHNSRTSVNKHSKAAANPITTNFTNDCANDWALDLSRGINGTNNVNPTSTAGNNNPWAQTCVTSGNYLNGTDSLVVRHAEPEPVTTLVAGQVYLTSEETPLSVLFVGDNRPTDVSTTALNYKLASHGYYVRNYSFEDSTGAALDAIPMLRRITLSVDGTNTAIVDEEIAVGVEDFQIEFGVDTSNLDDQGRGSVNRYVTPDNLILDRNDATGVYNPLAQVVSVRVWLLIRSQNPEFNYSNTATYDYADKSITVNDQIRRLLISRTFQIRNVT